ncbi:unnamed protein product, partial [Ixodes pacificus]
AVAHRWRQPLQPFHSGLPTCGRPLLHSHHSTALLVFLFCRVERLKVFSFLFWNCSLNLGVPSIIVTRERQPIRLSKISEPIEPAQLVPATTAALSAPVPSGEARRMRARTELSRRARSTVDPFQKCALSSSCYVHHPSPPLFGHIL